MGEAFEKMVGASLGAFGVWAVLAGIIFPALAKAFPEWRKVSGSNEGAIRDTLIHRIDTLEKRIGDLESEAQRQREKHELEMNQQRDQHEAENRIMRHKLNNESATLDMLLMLFEAAPDRISEHIERIKQMRAERARNVAIESGAMSASSLNDGRAVV